MMGVFANATNIAEIDGEWGLFEDFRELSGCDDYL